MIKSTVITNKSYQGINPVQFGYEDCINGHSFGPAIRTYWLLHYVVSGKGYFHIKDRKYTLCPGEIFVIPPFVETYYEADSEDPWSYIWVGFNASEEVPLAFEDVIKLPAARQIFQDMKQCAHMSAGRTEFLCSKIWLLISEALNQKEEALDYTQQAIMIMESEYMTDLSVQTIADKLGLERTYFSDMFKKKAGICPKQYLLQHRMNQAMLLIRDYGYSISVAACSVGYSDIYNFSKMFKRHFGASPSAFRKAKQEYR